MKQRAPAQGLYAIADGQFGAPFLLAESLFSHGCGLIQVRAKDWPPEQFLEQGWKTAPALVAAGCTLIINDHIEVARALRASGVHLGQDDACPARARERLGAEAIIGLSTHDLDQVSGAADVDYIGFGPVFTTFTKDLAGSPRGLALLGRAVAATSIPLYAIGGISTYNIHQVRCTGVHRWAVASALYDSGDLRGAIDALS